MTHPESCGLYIIKPGFESGAHSPCQLLPPAQPPLGLCLCSSLCCSTSTCPSAASTSLFRVQGGTHPPTTQSVTAPFTHNPGCSWLPCPQEYTLHRNRTCSSYPLIPRASCTVHALLSTVVVDTRVLPPACAVQSTEPDLGRPPMSPRVSLEQEGVGDEQHSCMCSV